MEILVGIWFWISILIVSGLIIWGLEEDNGVGTTAAAVIGGFAIWYLSGAPSIWPLFRDHWASLLMCIVGYVVIGALWGVAKWWFFLHNKGDEYEIQRQSIQQSWLAKSDPQKAQYANGYKDFVLEFGYPPKISRYKSDFTMWMVWWPFSALWTLLNDPLKRIYRFILQNLTTTLTRMSNAVFAGRFTELK